MVSDDDLAHFETMEDSEGLVSKSDLIVYVKKSNMFSQFDNVDTNSDVHWNTMVEKAWKLFDKNGDGKLTQLEFRWMTNKEILTDRQIALMFSKCDTDGDGVLDFEEFRKMILRNRWVSSLNLSFESLCLRNQFSIPEKGKKWQILKQKVKR